MREVQDTVNINIFLNNKISITYEVLIVIQSTSYRDISSIEFVIDSVTVTHLVTYITYT